MAVIVKIIYGEHSVKVNLDNGEWLKLPYSVSAEYSLSTGMDLTGEYYIKVYDESLKFACMEKALRYLSVRSRSVDELRKYLVKKGFRGEHIVSVISKVTERGYLNDYDFSLSFIKRKLAQKKYGREIIKRDLFLKGVERTIIDSAMKECNADVVDEEALLQLARKKYNSVKDKKNRYMKTAAFLKGRGFDYDSVRKVMERITGEIDDSRDSDAL